MISYKPENNVKIWGYQFIVVYLSFCKLCIWWKLLKICKISAKETKLRIFLNFILHFFPFAKEQTVRFCERLLWELYSQKLLPPTATQKVACYTLAIGNFHLYTVSLRVQLKDYERDKDDQEDYVVVINWPNWELYGAFICMIRYTLASMLCNQTDACFHGWWVTVDFD